MYQQTTLENGLRVVTSEMPHTRSATISVYVGAGSRYEPDEEAGLSHFLEHMLFKGASRRPTAKDISEAIERVGGMHNAATDRELTVYFARVPHRSALDTIDILADMIVAPIMDPAELEKERNVILDELASVEDSPGEVAGILADEVLWPSQPLGRAIGGTPESVQALPLEAVLRYFRAQYVPGNMVLSVAGRVDHGEVEAAAQRWFGDMRTGAAGPWYPVQPRNGAERIAVRQRPTEQAHICLTYPGVPLAHRDRYAMDLVSTLLGEGMSSRLFLELREERALVYDVHSFSAEFHDAGAFTIYAGCDPEDARTTVEAALAEVDRLLDDLTVEELEQAKAMTIGRAELRMEDTRAVAGWMGSQALLLNEVLTVDEVAERFAAVTIDDVRGVLREHLARERATLAAVGPFESDLFAGVI